MRSRCVCAAATVWALVALASGCTARDGGRSAPTPTTASPTAGRSPSPSPAGGTELPAGWARCTNDAVGYEIGYPGGWFTAHNNRDNACRWFDPRPFEVREATEGPLTALTVTVADRPFADMARALEEPHGQRALLLERSEIGGRPVLRYVVENTEEILYPAGTRSYGYLVALGNRSLLVETTSLPGATGREGNARVVDQAVRTLRAVATRE